jgi:glutaconate CoA-transferase subunit A
MSLVNNLVDVRALAALVPDGAKLVVAKDESGVAMAATCELVRRGVRGLHLVTVPVSGLQADVLIGAGCVATIESSGITLSEFGTGPCFTRAVKAGTIRLKDATCPAIYAGLQAAQKGLPFMPLRGIIGSDVLKHRDDWRVIDNPFGSDDKIVAIAAIQPDVALFHAPMADRFGNVFIGRQRELMLLAHASRRTLVTVEQVIEGNLLDDNARSGATIPALYVEAIAHAPKGMWPLGYGDAYPIDAAWMCSYAQMARTAEGFEALVAQWLAGRIVLDDGLKPLVGAGLEVMA